ncbi:DUF924 family protein [Piscinibacter sp.]|uniref:DUF924 family protein n=1 Tax=Piscinibacter sp. TaxID=1903157 RepID=UPI00391FAC84
MRPQEVLDFWFGAAGSAERGKARAAWFRKDPAFDALIAGRFGAQIEQALAGGLREWEAEPGSALARILLLDQFTRNVFRDTPRAFEGDALALPAARRMVARGHDLALAPFERSFVYLPFEHAEDMAAQDEAVRLFERLAAASPECADMLPYSHRHRDIVARFGRFPHRNAILGRASTAEEAEFLLQPGSGF